MKVTYTEIGSAPVSVDADHASFEQGGLVLTQGDIDTFIPWQTLSRATIERPSEPGPSQQPVRVDVSVPPGRVSAERLR
jgi:hypothetical protein